jgi:hypothetical protein
MCEISFINKPRAAGVVACVILKITIYESDTKLLAVSTVNFSLSQITFYLKYTKVKSVKFPQILKWRSVHFWKPNIDSSAMNMVAVNETTAASVAGDSKKCHSFAKRERQLPHLIRRSVNSFL